MKTLNQLSYEFQCVDVYGLSPEEIEGWWMNKIKGILNELKATDESYKTCCCCALINNKIKKILEEK